MIRRVIGLSVCAPLRTQTYVNSDMAMLCQSQVERMGLPGRNCRAFAVQPAVKAQQQPRPQTGSGYTIPGGVSQEDHIALVDASYYCFKYYHAFARNDTSDAQLRSEGPDGTITTIHHMFLKLLLRLISDSMEHQQQVAQGAASSASGCDSPFGFPTGIVVLFDQGRTPEAVSVRRELHPEYKANRGEPVSIVHDAMRELPEVLQQMGINHLGLDNVEADDLIATLSASFSNTCRVTIYSADKDFKQLLSDRVCMVSHNPQGTRCHTLESFSDQFPFQPYFFPDFQALTGDSSDNVKGVPGVGEKTAKALIEKHSTVENLYTALHTCKPSARIKKLKEVGVKEVILLKCLFQLYTNVRSPDGSHVAELLPFPPAHLLDKGAVQMDSVAEYCEKRDLRQVLELFNQVCSRLPQS